MKVLVTGSTGFLGSRLMTALESPVVLSTNPASARERFPSAAVHAWDPVKGELDPAVFDGVDAVENLAGESINARWTDSRKQRILTSRVNSASLLARTIARLAEKPRVVVSASATGIYGSRGDEELTESSAPGTGFLAEVCVKWEAAIRPVADAGVRLVNLRTGVVFGIGGGALAAMETPFRLGLGGRLGNGRQWMPWISRHDLTELVLFALEHVSLTGPVNAVSPNPVTNTVFTREFARALGRPSFFPVPSFALELALGEMASVLLSSQRAVPRSAQAAGFQFQYADLAAYLKHYTSVRSRPAGR